MRVYLDNAATTPLDSGVLEAMMPYLTEQFGNPSSQYSYGRETRAAIEAARKDIAALIGAQPGEIVFTSGGTESNNMALKGAVHDLGVKRIITSAIEHHCVEHTVEYLKAQEGITVDLVRLDGDGHVDLADLERLLQIPGERTLVSLMHANNEIGTLLDIRRTGELCRQYEAFFHSDSVQTFAHFPLDVRELAVDFLTGSAHKFHGPKGAGFLYMRKQHKVKAFIHGGGQERGYRAGTENVYGIVGLAAAAKAAYASLDADQAYIRSLKERLKQGLLERIEGVQFNGDITADGSLYTVLNVSFPSNDKTVMLLFSLDLEGICVSGGSACSSGASTGSHVLTALGKDPDRVSVRFSFSKHNTPAEIDRTLEVLGRILS